MRLGRVFVTGGTGLVGSHLVALLRDHGVAVRALVRPGSDRRHLHALGCEIVEGGLDAGANELGEAVEGCDALVHAAAITYSRLSLEEVRTVNVGGTRRLLEGAVAAGVPRLVLLSTAAVYGDPPVRPGGGGLDEETPVDAPLRPWEHYARSKREAEGVARRIVENSAASLVTLRPSAVYGERDRLFTPLLGAWLRAPVHLLAGSGRAPLPAVYAGNLAGAIVAALQGPATPGTTRTYNVTSDHPLSQRNFFAALARATGRPFRPLPLPAPLLLAGARLVERLGGRLPGAEELPLSRWARYAAYPDPYTSERIRRELGWTPEISLDEALERTGIWWAAVYGARAGEAGGPRGQG